MSLRPVKEMPVSELYEGLRPLMFSIAYRMVGSVSEAEDITQEAFLRFHRESKEGTVIESPKATTALAGDDARTSMAFSHSIDAVVSLNGVALSSAVASPASFAPT